MTSEPDCLARPTTRSTFTVTPWKIMSPSSVIRLFAVILILASDYRSTVEPSRSGGGRARRRLYNDRDYPYPDYSYHYRDDGGAATPPRPPPPLTPTSTGPPTYIKCYACYYKLEHNAWIGREGCAEPFSPVDIPIVDCPGSCGRVYQKLPDGPKDFTVNRNCMERCKEDESTLCCLTDLCNGAVSVSPSAASASVAVVLAVAALLAAFIQAGCCCC